MRPRFALCALLAAVLVVACDGGGDAPASTPAPVATPAFDPYAVGRPQGRTGIGDVERALARFESSRADLIEAFHAQPWFQDGLSADEALFVERSLSFVAGQRGDSFRTVSRAAVEDKLYLYEKVPLRNREIDLLLIYEPGQNAEAEFDVMKAVIPRLETLVGVEWPEQAITVINGQFEINDYNNGGFIRIARCCVRNAFILAHELAHTYWSMGPSWFNEGMADIYATMALQDLDGQAPAGWRTTGSDVDALFRARRGLLDSDRFPPLRLGERFASDGLYELADAFLLSLRDIIGDSAFRASAGDIYAASDFGRFGLRDKRIEDIILSHAAEGDREDVMELFNREVWGDNGEEYRRLQEFEDS